MIRVKVKGSFKNTESFLNRVKRIDPEAILRKYGEMGVQALSESTPVDTGLTASSWYYEITKEKDLYKLTFSNSNIQNGRNIAVIVDLGHGTSNGGYVRGRNYIKPAIRPVLDEIASAAWKEVTDAK